MSQKETTTKSKSPMYGKAWRRASVHTSYETAAAEKERLTTEQSDVTVKIRRTADHKFVVKIFSFGTHEEYILTRASIAV